MELFIEECQYYQLPEDAVKELSPGQEFDEPEDHSDDEIAYTR